MAVLWNIKIPILLAVSIFALEPTWAAPMECPSGHHLETIGNPINFRWSIHNFSIRAEEVGEHLTSPLFPTDGSSSSSKWLLWLFPFGEQDHISLFVCLESMQTAVHLADYHFWLLGKDYASSGKTFYSHSELPRKFPDENGHCWGQKNLLLRASLDDYLSEDGTLHILCQLQLRHDSHCVEIPDVPSEAVVNPVLYTDWCDTHYRVVDTVSSVWKINNVTQVWAENKVIDSPPIKGIAEEDVDWETDIRFRVVEQESGDSDKYAGLFVCLLKSKKDKEVLATNKLTVLSNSESIIDMIDVRQEDAALEEFATPKVRRFTLESHKPPSLGACWGWSRAFTYEQVIAYLDGEHDLQISTEINRMKEITSCSKDLPSISKPCISPPPEKEDPDRLIVQGISELVPEKFLNSTGQESLPVNVIFLYSTLVKNEQKDAKDKTPHVKARGAFVSKENPDIRGIGIVSDLLVLAHNNKLDDLKQTCQELLEASLTGETTARILMAAEDSESFDLKVKALDYLEEHSNEVLSTDDYKKLLDTHPNLGAEISWRIFGKEKPEAE